MNLVFFSIVQLFWNLFIYRYNKIGMFSETMWLSSKITEMLASKLIPKADVFLEASKVNRECCCFLDYMLEPVYYNEWRQNFLDQCFYWFVESVTSEGSEWYQIDTI